MSDLSEKQKEAVEAIEQLTQKTGKGPTRTDLKVRLGLPSQEAVRDLVNKLYVKGYVQTGNKTGERITLVGGPSELNLRNQWLKRAW